MTAAHKEKYMLVRYKQDGMFYRRIGECNQAASWPEILDDACETMEMAGMHEESSYKALKRLHAEMAQLLTPNAQDQPGRTG